MAKYIIKNHYEATEANTNFAGDIHDWYTGVGGTIIGNKNKFPSEWEIENYGYKTFAAAKRGLKAAQETAEFETKYGFWNVTVEMYAC